MTDVKAQLAAARPSQKVVPVYVTDLSDRIAELDAQLVDAKRARGDRANPGPEERRLAREIEALRAQMEESRIDVRLVRTAPKAWKQLCAEHPPRFDDAGAVIPDDAIGVNIQTFFEPAIRKCWAEPAMDEEDFTTLFEVALSPVQLDQLADAVWVLNRRTVSVPFSLAASLTIQTSEPE